MNKYDIYNKAIKKEIDEIDCEIETTLKKLCKWELIALAVKLAALCSLAF